MTIVTRAPADETLYPNDGNCRRFAALSRAFAQRTSDRWNHTSEMEYLNKLISKWMPDGGKVAVDSRPRLSGIMDTINSTLAHGKPLPYKELSEYYEVLKFRGLSMNSCSVDSCYLPACYSLSKKLYKLFANMNSGPETRLPKEFYDEKGRKIIDKIGVEEWFSGYQESHEYRSLGIGGLMGDLVQRMVGNAQGNKSGGQ